MSASSKPRSWRRRLGQFSLGTLLILTTIGALTMGGWRSWVRPWLNEQEATKELPKYLQVDLQRIEPRAPAFVGWFGNPEYPNRTVELVVRSSGGKPEEEEANLEAGLKAIGKFDSLKTLTIIYPRGGDPAKLAPLGEMASLESLNLLTTFNEEDWLGGAPFPARIKRLELLAASEQIAYLPADRLRQLEELTVAPGPNSAAELRHLAAIPNLKRLEIYSDVLDEEDLAALQEFPSLETFELRRTGASQLLAYRLDQPIQQAMLNQRNFKVTLENLSDYLNYPVAIDRDSMRKVGVDAAVANSIDMSPFTRKKPMREELTAALAPLQLDFVPGEQQITVMSRDDAQQWRNDHWREFQQRTPTLQRVVTPWTGKLGDWKE